MDPFAIYLVESCESQMVHICKWENSVASLHELQLVALRIGVETDKDVYSNDMCSINIYIFGYKTSVRIDTPYTYTHSMHSLLLYTSLEIPHWEHACSILIEVVKLLDTKTSDICYAISLTAVLLGRY